MLAQKQTDQTVVKLVDRLKSQGYELRPNASRHGRSGVDFTFDYLVLRRDGFTNLLAAIEVIYNADDPETSLHRLFAFQDKCTECGISHAVVIALPRLSFVAGQFARKDGVEVFDEQAIQMFLGRPPSARASPAEVPKTFTQKSEVYQSLRALGYKVDENVRVVAESGADHVFGAMALQDDGFMLARLGIDCLYSDTVEVADVSLFDDKCRDAGVVHKLLLVPKGLTEEARKLAQEKKIEVIILDGRPREVVLEGTDALPALPLKPRSNGSRPGSPDGPKPHDAAAGSLTPPADKPIERKKTVVVSEVKLDQPPALPAPPPAAAHGEGPPPDKAAPAVAPGTTTQPGGQSVFNPLEPAGPPRQFSMRSVIDQFLGPQVRPATPDRPPGDPLTAAGAEAKPAAKEARPAEAAAEAAAALKEAAEAASGGTAQATDEAKAKPAEPSGPATKEARSAEAAAKAAEALKEAAEALKSVAPGRPAPSAPPRAAGDEPQKPKSAQGKAGQAGAGRAPVAPKSAGGDRDPKQGVVGMPGAVAANAQFLKPSLDKASGDKHPGSAAKGPLPEKPGAPSKPVVEEPAEKPKVKLSKAARPEALQAIPESTARRFTVLPISVNDNTLEVAMVNPSDLATIQVLELQSKMRVKAVGADQKEILDAIDFNYKAFGQIAEQISHIETVADASQGVDLVASTANAPVAAALNLIVEEAVKARASDIHLEPEEKRLRVRYRIDGVLQEVMSLPVKIHPPLTSRVKVMSDLNIADRLRPQDGQFSLDVKGKSVDVRVATSPTVNGETVVMRILDKSMAMMELPQLGFTEECLAKYMKMLAVPFGMICVSGPTGSGKTTTLYASLNTMDKVTRNIITAEDPVEYRFEGIKQIQVNPKAGLTFASVLRSMMRLDPDVILVGEIRDAETASIAVKAALTGHTVLCSIHANDAVSVVYRLLDLGVEPFMVASVITGTLAQRMARRVCTNCAVATKPTEVEAAAYESVMGEKLSSFVSGTGCDLCNFSGYKGRLGLYEVLAMTDAARALVLKGATTAELRNQAVKEGMVTLSKDGMQKVKAGKTTVAEVIRNAYSIE